jgi:hypothetical protein
MKKIVIIALFFVASTSFAQGNLQFNQVITGAGQLLFNQSSSVYTVPTGKAAKIEAINSNGSGNSNLSAVFNTFEIPILDSKFPIWLKAGDTFKVKGTNNDGFSYRYVYSIIEFNIIP